MLPRRQKRYDDLTKKGLMHFEALALSRLPKYVPYVNQIARQRMAELNHFTNLPSNQYKNINTVFDSFYKGINKRYADNGWVSSQGLYTKESAWNMLRNYERAYKKDHPEYERNKNRYPKQAHHRNSERTSAKLNISQLDRLKSELKLFGKVENDRTRSLKEQIARIENKD
jgi:hypothetical protein